MEKKIKIVKQLRDNLRESYDDFSIIYTEDGSCFITGKSGTLTEITNVIKVDNASALESAKKIANKFYINAETSELSFYDGKKLIKFSKTSEGQVSLEGKEEASNDTFYGKKGEKFGFYKFEVPTELTQKITTMEEKVNGIKNLEVLAKLSEVKGKLQYNGKDIASEGSAIPGFDPHEYYSKIELDKKIGIDELLTSSKTINGAINELFQKSYSIRKLFANAIGKPDMASSKASEISNDIIKSKEKIVQALKSKKMETATNDGSLDDYADLINRIVVDSKIKNTKLNVERGTQRKIEFTNPITIEECCTCAYEYKGGGKEVVKYECNFDNGDASNFNYEKDIFEFNDGTMSQKNKYEEKKMDIEKEAPEGKYFKQTINLDEWNQIYDISVDEREGEDNQFLCVSGTSLPKFVTGKDDINLKGVDSISKIEWQGTIAGENEMKFIFSNDSGVTWNSIDKDTNKLIVVNISKPDNIEQAISTNKLSTLKTEQLNLLMSKPIVRFGYYFNKKDYSNKLSNDKISLTVNMRGTSIKTNNTDWELSEDGRSLTYTFKEAGTYTIVYADSI